MVSPTRFVPPTVYSKVEFRLTSNQIGLLNAWLKGIHQEAAAIQLRQIEEGKRHVPFPYVPYYGAVGGGLTFRFTSTGIGPACSVTEAITGKTLDLSEYENW